MNMLNYLPLPLVRLLAFFHEELSEKRPGRLAQTMQLWAGCLLVVLISMTLEVPFLAISLAVLFYGIQSNAYYTKFVSFLFVAATVLEIGSLFLIYKWAYSYPLIRMIVASLVLLGCMFMMRTHRLGLLFFAVAIIAVYGQTFPGMLDYPEIVVRLTLWCIVVGLYPTLLMALIGVLWFPSRAANQMREALCDKLDDALDRLTTARAPLAEKYVEREALALQKLNVFCMADDPGWKARSAWWQTCVATVTYLYTTLNRYPASAAQHPALAQRLDQEIASLRQAIAQGEPWQSAWEPNAAERAAAQACGLENLCEQLRQLGLMAPDTPPTPPAPQPAMAPDAWSNPAYIRYALKTLLACMICYVFYSGVDWEGIHTCMLTCIIVANPTIGSSWQKMALRFGGAVCGAVLALVVTIGIMPWLDNIVELLCVLAPIFLFSAWVATGSERSSYIGTQLVVTFSLATLENVFGPVYDLVEIRDRAVGILIGTAVSAVIYTFIWPESEAAALPKKLADALRTLGKLLRVPQTQRSYLQLRIGCHAAFNACAEMCDRVALEHQLDEAQRAQLLARSRAVIHESREMLYRWENAPAPELRLAEALECYAAEIAGGRAAPPVILSDISPALSEQAQGVMQHMARLPDWTRQATSTGEQTQGVTSR